MSITELLAVWEEHDAKMLVLNARLLVLHEERDRCMKQLREAEDRYRTLAAQEAAPRAPE
jgi:hypothetical protein